MYGKREDVKEKLQQINGLKSPHWEDTSSLSSLVEDCRIALAQLDYLTINKKMVQLQNNLADLAIRSNAHPINANISRAFRERDIDKYCKLLEEVDQLCKKAAEVNKKRQIIGKIAEKVSKVWKKVPVSL